MDHVSCCAVLTQFLVRQNIDAMRTDIVGSAEEVGPEVKTANEISSCSWSIIKM